MTLNENRSEISVNIQCVVEYSENIDLSAGFDYVRDSVMTMQQDTHIVIAPCCVKIPDFRKLPERLDLVVNSRTTLIATFVFSCAM